MAVDVATDRRAALDALLPAWTEQRRRVAELKSAVKELRADLAEHAERLGRTEADLEHVGACRLDACLRCEELALNGAEG